jgi:hypothetical protein
VQPTLAFNKQGSVLAFALQLRYQSRSLGNESLFPFRLQRRQVNGRQRRFGCGFLQRLVR